MVAFSAALPPCIVAMEVCCGAHFLGRSFVAHAQKAGLNVQRQILPPLPPVAEVDYVVVVAILYHFKAEAEPFVDSLWEKARKGMIILEPINNRSSHSNRLISKISRLMSHPGVGELPVRFSETEMDALLNRYQQNGNSYSKVMSDGRDKLYVLHK